MGKILKLSLVLNLAGFALVQVAFADVGSVAKKAEKAGKEASDSANSGKHAVNDAKKGDINAAKGNVGKSGSKAKDAKDTITK